MAMVYNSRTTGRSYRFSFNAVGAIFGLMGMAPTFFSLPTTALKSLYAVALLGVFVSLIAANREEVAEGNREKEEEKREYERHREASARLMAELTAAVNALIAAQEDERVSRADVAQLQERAKQLSLAAEAAAYNIIGRPAKLTIRMADGAVEER
jgi:hypothetical protein